MYYYCIAFFDVRNLALCLTHELIILFMDYKIMLKLQCKTTFNKNENKTIIVFHLQKKTSCNINSIHVRVGILVMSRVQTTVIHVSYSYYSNIVQSDHCIRILCSDLLFSGMSTKFVLEISVITMQCMRPVEPEIVYL